MARDGGGRAVAHSVSPDLPRIFDPRLRQLLAYWNKERGERPLPARTDIDPVELKFLLGYIMLLDVLPEPRQFRVRLQGTELQWWLGCDLTGKALDQLPSAELVAVAHDCLASTVETRAPFHKMGDELIGDMPRRFEALLLPLASDGVVIDIVLAAVLCRDERAVR
jgi:hypothetical protein